MPTLLLLLLLQLLLQPAQTTWTAGLLPDAHAQALLQEVSDVQREFDSLPEGLRKLMQAGQIPKADGSQQPTLTSAQVDQLAIQVAELRIVSEAIGLASGILNIVYGALGTAASAISIELSGYSLVTSPVTFYISEYQFQQTLYGDTNRLIDGSDYLGDAAKYIKLFNKLKAVLGTDGQSWLQGQSAQLSSTQSMVAAAAHVLNSAIQSLPM